jgi:uncharacterized membrane protein
MCSQKISAFKLSAMYFVHLFIYFFVVGSIWRRINYENVQAYSTHERMKKGRSLFTVACIFQHSFLFSISLSHASG